MSILLSIIIPVYNSEKYLQTCLDSIPIKNNKIETIVIDDASNKKLTKNIINLEKNKNNIILIKNKINIGVGNTRNKGIRKARGKFLLFLDSDDKLNTSNLENLLNVLKTEKNDLIYCRFIKETFPKDNIEILKKLKNSNKASNLKRIAGKIQYLGDDCWPFIVKRKFLIKNKIFFPKNIRVAEDEYFTTKLLLKMKTYSTFDKIFYIHTDREGSLSSDLSSFTNNTDFIKLFYLFIDILVKEKIKIVDKQILFRHLRVLYSRIMFLLPIRDIKEKKILYQKIKKNNSKLKIQIIKKYKLFYLLKILEIKNYYMFEEMEKNFYIEILSKTKQINNLFIYCRTLIAKGLNKILFKNNKNIIYFIDDAKIKNKKFEEVKVINQSILIRKIKKYKNDYLIIIANNRSKTFKKIRDKLIKNKIPSNKIKQFY